MTISNPNVIFLGASTRAAAVSARRAGWSPWCADLFADADLQRIATARKIPAEEYPQGLLRALAEAPQVPVIYTGALENRPRLLARVGRPLWGNSPQVLQAVRNPEQWTRLLSAYRIACPAISKVPTSAGRWLLKPRHSGGGHGIQWYHGQSFNPRVHFLHEWIDGTPCSAIFLGHEHSVFCYGVTQQLVGTPWLNATGFHYAGSIGPLPLDSAAMAPWHYLGTVLTKLFCLRGLFGVDAIVSDGVPCPVEINPRYTASVELLERAYHVPLLTSHRAVFEELPLPTWTQPKTPTIWGKAILYARKTFCFPEAGPWLASLEHGVDLDQTEYADIPHSGDIIDEGHPVLTLFASTTTVAECEAKLQEKALTLDRCLWS